MRLNVKQEISKNPILLVTIPSEKYNQAAVDIAKQLATYTIRYVTLNKTRDSVLESLGSKSFSDLCFIDGITKLAVKQPKKIETCTFLNSPNDLKGLASSVNKDTHDVLIFDSLSTLLIYENVATVTKFVKDLIKNAGSRKFVFMILKGDKEKLLTNNLRKSVSKVIELK